MNVPTIRELLAQDRVLIGAWNYLPHYDYTGLIAEAGFDFIIVDMEHGGRSIETIQLSVMAANARGVPAIVRTLEKAQWAIEQALDIGAQGILVPTVETAEEANLVVQASRFAPLGDRGYCPMQRVGNYGAKYDIVSNSDRDVFVSIILESPKAYENLDAILAVEGIDAFQPGPGDLSIRLGLALGAGASIDPKVHGMLKTAYEKILAAGKIAWNPGHPKMGHVDLKTNFRMCMGGSDTDLLSHLRQSRADAVKLLEQARN